MTLTLAGVGLCVSVIMCCMLWLHYPQPRVFMQILSNFTDEETGTLKVNVKSSHPSVPLSSPQHTLFLPLHTLLLPQHTSLPPQRTQYSWEQKYTLNPVYLTPHSQVTEQERKLRAFLIWVFHTFVPQSSDPSVFLTPQILRPSFIPSSFGQLISFHDGYLLPELTILLLTQLSTSSISVNIKGTRVCSTKPLGWCHVSQQIPK